MQDHGDFVGSYTGSWSLFGILHILLDIRTLMMYKE